MHYSASNLTCAQFSRTFCISHLCQTYALPNKNQLLQLCVCAVLSTVGPASQLGPLSDTLIQK